MDILIDQWRVHFLNTSPVVADLRRKVLIYRRQRNRLVSILLSIAGIYIKKVMDGQVKE